MTRKLRSFIRDELLGSIGVAEAVLFSILHLDRPHILVPCFWVLSQELLLLAQLPPSDGVTATQKPSHFESEAGDVFSSVNPRDELTETHTTGRFIDSGRRLVLKRDQQ